MNDTAAGTEKVVDLLKKERIAMITIPSPSGELHARPMTVIEVADDGDLWFFIDAGSEQAAQIAAAPQLNASFAGSSSWISVAGVGRVVRDQVKIDALWNKVVEAWFEGGRQDPNVALLHIDSQSAHYWDSPGGKLATVFAFAKAKVAGERYEGDSGTVQLPDGR